MRFLHDHREFSKFDFEKLRLKIKNQLLLLILLKNTFIYAYTCVYHKVNIQIFQIGYHISIFFIIHICINTEDELYHYGDRLRLYKLIKWLYALIN